MFCLQSNFPQIWNKKQKYELNALFFYFLLFCSYLLVTSTHSILCNGIFCYRKYFQSGTVFFMSALKQRGSIFFILGGIGRCSLKIHKDIINRFTEHSSILQSSTSSAEKNNTIQNLRIRAGSLLVFTNSFPDTNHIIRSYSHHKVVIMWSCYFINNDIMPIKRYFSRIFQMIVL